jgi:formylglycine-generating enzyme
VTQAQYEGVTNTNPSQYRGPGGRTAPDYPVESMSWHAAAAFGGKCFVEGHTVCLPTSDQWEYAARGGLGNKRPFYWGDAITSEHAAMQGGKPYGTDKATPNATVMPVGSYEKVVPHPWGLCDMVGNVAEWTDSKEGSWFRIVRGGGYRDAGQFCRLGFRVGNNPNTPFKNSTACDDRGFRVALVPDRK